MRGRGLTLAASALVALSAAAARDVAAQTARVVRGTVTDAATGAPVGGAAVDAGGRRVYADASGRFTLAASPGDTILVRRMGYRPARLAVGSSEAAVALAPAALPLAAVRV
ncbi:MAG: carboxypeptidase regulatory-like domain-containing protein, partial [Gemmatimonadaceae bacterium]